MVEVSLYHKQAIVSHHYSNQPTKFATIIGATGYIGRALKAKLNLLGYTLSTPPRDSIDTLHGKMVGELYYCAGATNNYAINPAQTIHAHITQLAELLDKCDFRSIVYLSSTRLYDRHNPSNEYRNSSPITGHSDLTLNPTNPRHLFDLTKAAGEAACLALAADKARIARLACVWDLTTNGHGFLWELLRKIEAAKQNQQPAIQIETCPSTTRHYIHLNDCIDALIRMGRLCSQEQIISVASDESPTKNKQLISTLEAIYGIRIAMSSHSAHATGTAPQTPTITLNDLKELMKPKTLTPFLQDLHLKLTQKHRQNENKS